MNSRQHLTRCARHPAVCYERNPEAAILQDPQVRCEFVQLGHAVGARSLPDQDGDEILLEFAGIESIDERLL